MKSRFLKLAVCSLLLINSKFLFAQYHSSLDFDGIDDYCITTNASQLVGSSQAMSMSFWVYPRNSNPGFPDFDGFAGFRNNVNCDFYLLQLTATDVEARFRGDNGTASDIVFSGLQLNTWQHFLFVYDGTTISLYHNGVLGGTAPASGSFQTTSDPFYVGMLPYQNTQFFTNGILDDVALWSSALTQADAQCLYNANALNLINPSLELYYGYNDGLPGANNSGLTSVIDFSSNKMNGALNGFSLNGANSNFAYGVSQNFGLVVDTGCAGQPYLYNGIAYTVPGVYASSVSNGSCDSMFMLFLNQNTVQIVVSQIGATLNCLTTNATYQWLDCNNGFAIIPNATNATYIATVNGSYAVAVTQNGCTDTSICKNVVNIGIQQIDKSEIVISPNPAQDFVSISGNITSEFQVAIYDNVGTLVYQSHDPLTTINISAFAKGIYTIELLMDQLHVRKSFIKE